jgi:PAS domain S-box-containing protein
MPLRIKTLLVTCAILVGLIAILYFTSNLMLGSGIANGEQRYLLAALIFAGLVFGLANRAVLNGFIFSRLNRLRAEIQRIGESGDLTARLSTTGKDELAKLAERINEMLGALEKSQQQRLESEQRYRVVVQETAEGIFLLDLETGRILEANAAFQNQVGFTAEELMHLTLYDLAAYDRDGIDEDIKRLLAEKRQSFGERKYRRKSGSLVEAEISASLITYGGRQAACVVARDITQRKWAEDALRRNEAYFRALIDNSLDVMGILNSDGTVCYLSLAVERMLGFKPERLMGRNAFDMVHPDDAAKVRCVFANGIQNTGFTASVEFRLQHQDGAWVNLETSARSLLDNPAVMGIVFSMRDVTARKQAEQRIRESEERYRQEVENSPNAIFSVNREGMIQTWNRACENIFKYGQEVIGRDLSELLLETGDNPRLANMREQVFHKQWLSDVEISYRAQDGTVRLMTSRLYPLLDGGGEVEGCVIANTDITERKRGEAQIEQRANEFAALYEITRDLAAQRDLPSLLQTIVVRAVALLGATSGSIFRYDAARKDLELVVATGPELSVGTHFELGEGMAGLVAQTFEPLIVDDYRIWGNRSRQVNDVPFSASIEVPMLYGGELIGVLAVNEVGDTTRKFTEADARLLALFAAQAASAVHNAHLLQQTRARAEQLALLYDAGLALNSVLEPRAQLEFLFKIAMKTLHADRAEYFRYDSARGELRLELGVGYPEGTQGALRELVFALGAERGVVGQVAQERIPKYIPDVRADPCWIVVDPEIRSALCVPVEHETQLLGVVSVLSNHTHAFSPQDERLLVLFANQVAVALENARLFMETRRRADQLALLNRVSNALSQTLDLDELLEVIYREINAALHADAFFIALYDLATDELNYRIRVDEGVRAPPERRGLTPGLIAHVIRSKKPLLIHDWEQERDHYPPIRLWGTMKVPRAWLNVPMLFRDTVVGVISLQSYQANAFGDEEERLLATIADQAAVAVEKARLFAETGHRLQRLHALSDIDRAISSSLDLRVILEVVLDQVTTQLRVDAADILLHNLRTQTLSYASSRGFRSRALQYTELRLGEGLAGMAALERRVVHFPNLTQEADGLRRSPLLANEAFVAYFAFPLVAKGRIKGVLEIFHRAPLEPDQEWLDFAQALASQAAIAIDDAELFQDLQRTNVELTLAYDATIEGWSRALELRDQETEGHAARVTELTLRLARRMGMGDQELGHMRHGALLHDIGKMAIPDGILFKPGALSAAEWEVMRRHPKYAYEMLSPIAYLSRALDVPYCHHEKWDGTGYPRGLKGEQIPLAARIFAVVDVWDALRSDRSYRGAWSEDQVYMYIRDQAGKHFDPKVVEEFLKIDTKTG